MDTLHIPLEQLTNQLHVSFAILDIRCMEVLVLQHYAHQMEPGAIIFLHVSKKVSTDNIIIFEQILNSSISFGIMKVSKGAKIRNRYNKVPHLTQDTNGKVTNSQ